MLICMAVLVCLLQVDLENRKPRLTSWRIGRQVPMRKPRLQPLPALRPTEGKGWSLRLQILIGFALRSTLAEYAPRYDPYFSESMSSPSPPLPAHLRRRSCRECYR